MLITYTISHFLVDFACGWAIFHSAAYSEIGILCILLYNFLAFAMQMPLGLWADSFKRNAWCAAAGCALTGLACCLHLHPLALTILAGVGNALFHLGGGIDVLNSCGRRSGPLGIFVSTGAFGIFYGCRLGHSSPDWGLAIALVLALAATTILVQQWRRCHSWQSANAPLAKPHFNSAYALAAACLFAVVVLRSYMGFALAFPWKALAPWGTLALCALVAGKMCGGLIADRLGMLKASIVTLALAALLFLFADQPLAGILAILLFNMTMPITLGALAAISPGCKGLAFGALTLGLFLGSLPNFFDIHILSHTPLSFCAITLISLALLGVGLKQAETHLRSSEDAFPA